MDKSLGTNVYLWLFTNTRNKESREIQTTRAQPLRPPYCLNLSWKRKCHFSVFFYGVDRFFVCLLNEWEYRNHFLSILWFMNFFWGGGGGNCKGSLKYSNAFRSNAQIFDNYEFCMTVPRYFVQDCRLNKCNKCTSIKGDCHPSEINFSAGGRRATYVAVFFAFFVFWQFFVYVVFADAASVFGFFAVAFFLLIKNKQQQQLWWEWAISTLQTGLSKKTICKQQKWRPLVLKQYSSDTRVPWSLIELCVNRHESRSTSRHWRDSFELPLKKDDDCLKASNTNADCDNLVFLRNEQHIPFLEKDCSLHFVVTLLGGSERSNNDYLFSVEFDRSDYLIQAD